MNIGLDVDGTLADLMPGTLKVVEDETGIVVDIDKYDSWTYLQDTHGFSTKQVLGFMDTAWSRGLVTMLEPGIQEQMARLQNTGNVITVITQRTAPTHWVATKWLLDHGIPYDVLVFTTKLNKMDYPIDVVVDDSPYLAKDMDRYPDKTLYSLRQSWNESDPHLPNVVHVTSVAKALDAIERSL